MMSSCIHFRFEIMTSPFTRRTHRAERLSILPVENRRVLIHCGGDAGRLTDCWGSTAINSTTRRKASQ